MRTRRRRVAALCYSTPAGPERGVGGVRGGSRSVQPYDPLPPPDPSRPQSDRAGEASLVSAAVFQRAQKRRSVGERRDGPISCKSPRHRRKIDFRAPLNGSEHIVLLCLCKAALNYSVCACAQATRASVCPSARVLELIGLDSLLWEK